MTSVVDLPRCGTCINWTRNSTNDTGGCLELNNRHGNHLAYLNLIHDESVPLIDTLYSTAQASIVCRSDFGCVLHSRLGNQP